MNVKISQRLLHFFHVVSNVRPVYWILLYVCLVPVFALIFWCMPGTQFRIPDNAATDFGSWLYYSVVTITTLGFGDYTPAHGLAQAVTAIEVVCGLSIFGFFLNAVASMKSENDVLSRIEMQKKLHYAQEHEKIVRHTPGVLHNLNLFLSYCYAVTTPIERRNGDDAVYNPDFSLNDMRDMYEPSGLPHDTSHLPAVARLISAARRASLSLDTMQVHVDLTPWPALLEDSFAFVADVQVFSADETLAAGVSDPEMRKQMASLISGHNVDDSGGGSNLCAIEELYRFIRKCASCALRIETELTKISVSEQPPVA